MSLDVSILYCGLFFVLREYPNMPKEDLEQPLQKGWGITFLPPPWDTARPGRPLVMSHRAGGNEAPENTLAALRHAESVGSRVMQMDILSTADGTPVVFHDINMKRATGLDEDIRQASRASPLHGTTVTVSEILDSLQAQSQGTI